jgi:hypothetical protein
MRRLASSLVYPVALAYVLAVIALFPSIGLLSHELAQMPFMQVHPRFSGGEVVETIRADGVEWRVHRPVFDGLLWERGHGFVQIDALCETPPPNGAEIAPDCAGDGSPDFRLVLPAAAGDAPELVPLSPLVTGLESWAETDGGWIARVGLDRK